MRLIILKFIFAFIIGSSLSVTAQEHYCGAEYPQEMYDWMYSFQNEQDHARLSALPEVTYLPMVIHNLGTDNGAGYFGLDQIATMMCRMNNQFIPTGFHFYLAQDINYIPNSEWYDYSDFSIGNDMMFASNVPDVINYYINDDPAGNCGYYTYGADAIAVKKSCASFNDDTPSHEVGHYMSLPHPFFGWEGSNYYNDPISPNQQERVDGSNCTTRGDMICDTEPDYISNLWGCQPPSDMYDPNGDQVTPDTSLYMSYSNDACNTRFTEGQQQAMQQFLIQNRPNLLQPEPQINTVIGQPEPAFPAAGSTVPYNQILLAWDASENQDYYRVSITSSTLGLSSPPEVNTTDTFLLVDLEPDANYFWKVMAFSLTDFCNNDYSTASGFSTTSQAAPFGVTSVDIVTPDCPGAGLSSASITPIGGTAPYTFDWNGADPADLSDGLYEVTIYDAAGDSIIYPVVIDEPDAFNINVSIVDSLTNTAIIEASGGTAPYTYNWSDGNNGAEYPWLASGDYQVTITDANDCTEIVSFIHQAALSIFSQNVIHQQCFGEPSGSADIEVFGGEAPYIIEWQIGVDPDGLLPGTYDVTITDAVFNQIQTTVIIDAVPDLELNYTVASQELNQVNINATGGVPPLSLLWSNGHTLTTYVGLASGDYSVTVTDVNDCQETINFTYEALETGIEELGQISINLWPNPASTYVSIELEAAIESVSILDMNAKLIKDFGIRNDLDLRHISEGIYFIRIKTSDAIHHRKLVIAR